MYTCLHTSLWTEPFHGFDGEHSGGLVQTVREDLRESGGGGHAPAPPPLGVVVAGEGQQLARVELGLARGRGSARRLQHQRQRLSAQQRRAARRPWLFHQCARASCAARITAVPHSHRRALSCPAHHFVKHLNYIFFILIWLVKKDGLCKIKKYRSGVDYIWRFTISQICVLRNVTHNFYAVLCSYTVFSFIELELNTKFPTDEDAMKMMKKEVYRFRSGSSGLNAETCVVVTTVGLDRIVEGTV